MGKKKYASIAFTGAAALGAVGLGTGTARAASFHITPPNTPISASNSTSTRLTANGATLLTCQPGNAFLSGTTTSGGSTLVSSVTGSFLNCTSAGLGTYTAHVKKGHLVGNSYAPGSNSPATGVTTGSIQGVSASITGPGGCKISLTGNVSGKYHNSGILSAPGATSGLTINTVTGAPCTNVVAQGEAAGFKGTFTVNPVVTVTP